MLKRFSHSVVFAVNMMNRQRETHLFHLPADQIMKPLHQLLLQVVVAVLPVDTHTHTNDHHLSMSRQQRSQFSHYKVSYQCACTRLICNVLQLTFNLVQLLYPPFFFCCSLLHQHSAHYSIYLFFIPSALPDISLG